MALTFSGSAIPLPGADTLKAVRNYFFPESQAVELGVTDGFDIVAARIQPNYTEKYAKIAAIAGGAAWFLAKSAWDTLKSSKNKSSLAAILPLIAALIGTVLYDNWGKYKATTAADLRAELEDVDTGAQFGDVHPAEQLEKEFLIEVPTAPDHTCTLFAGDNRDYPEAGLPVYTI